MLLAFIRPGQTRAFLPLISTFNFYKLINQEVRFARSFYILTGQGKVRECEHFEVFRAGMLVERMHNSK